VRPVVPRLKLPPLSAAGSTPRSSANIDAVGSSRTQPSASSRAPLTSTSGVSPAHHASDFGTDQQQQRAHFEYEEPTSVKDNQRYKAYPFLSARGQITAGASSCLLSPRGAAQKPKPSRNDDSKRHSSHLQLDRNASACSDINLDTFPSWKSSHSMRSVWEGDETPLGRALARQASMMNRVAREVEVMLPLDVDPNAPSMDKRQREAGDSSLLSYPCKEDITYLLSR
jgi:hypothetical protein